MRTRRYAMTVDTRVCVGCNACVLGCKAENALPTNGYRDWIVTETRGTFPAWAESIWGTDGTAATRPDGSRVRQARALRHCKAGDMGNAGAHPFKIRTGPNRFVNIGAGAIQVCNMYVC